LRYPGLDSGVEQSAEVQGGLFEKATHKYKIVRRTSCPASKAFELWKQPNISAPGAPQAEEGIMDRRLTLSQPISQKVTGSTMTIVNATLSGHVFHPGAVTIQVQGTPYGSTFIITGVGRNDLGAVAGLNNSAGLSFFGSSAVQVENQCAKE
jgi:hypothetical protein